MRVLRLREGDAVELFDGRGTTAQGEIEFQGSQALVRLTETRKAPPPQPRVHVAAALPKGTRAKDMVNQLGQLGADQLTPLLTEHSVTDPRAGKLGQLERVAIESAKQCGRAYLMRVCPPQSFKDVLAQPHGLCLFADTAQPATPGGVGDAIAKQIAEAKDVLILIGPEGGWSDEERRMANDAGAVAWSLGPHTLRVETAAAAAVAVARYLTRIC